MKILDLLSQKKLYSYDELSKSLGISNETLKDKMLELENMGFAIRIFLKNSSCSPTACHSCAAGGCDPSLTQPKGLEDEDFIWVLTDQARSAI